jgi:hypothetical protein
MDIDDFLFDASEGAGGWRAVVRRKDGTLINSLPGMPPSPSLTKPNFATKEDAIKAAQDMVAAALKAGWQP